MIKFLVQCVHGDQFTFKFNEATGILRDVTNGKDVNDADHVLSADDCHEYFTLTKCSIIEEVKEVYRESEDGGIEVMHMHTPTTMEDQGNEPMS